MTDTEKENAPQHKTMGGFLRFSKSIYNGKSISEEDKNFLLSVPNFDADILEKTTGIVLKSTKTIILDDKEIEISEESYEEFKKQFKGE